MDIMDKIKNKEIKGYLTIKNRIIFEGATYHITQRAPGKEIVFVENSDYLKFLSILKETTEKFDLNIFCFSLLPNHLHLLLRISKKNLSEAMRHLFRTYAIYYNIKYERKGHVFCGRFRSSLCNDDAYLLAASLYIHLNPFKANLAENLNDYRWSSLRLYLDKPKKTFIDSGEILHLLDLKEKNARKKYCEILKESRKIPGGNLISTESVNLFVEKAKWTAKRFYKKDSEVDETIENFRKKTRIIKPKEKKARKYLVQQLHASGYTIKEICDLLEISRKTFYNILT
ncbi:transposase [candidate division WOR-3 bacterium]|nr:transposase [candidate division WOR-3 bacterium]